MEANDTPCSDCGGPTDGGDGWNGRCGNCADRVEMTFQFNADETHFAKYGKTTFKAGDRVFWHDPDVFLGCSGPGTICEIHSDEPELFSETIIVLEMDDGGWPEVLPGELEVLVGVPS